MEPGGPPGGDYPVRTTDNSTPELGGVERDITRIDGAPTKYIKKGGRVGRPSTAAKIAKTNTKISEFFPPTGGQQLPRGS